MEKEDVFWFAAFLFLFFVMHLTHIVIVNSLKLKPLGSQSIFDSAVLDYFVVIRSYGTYVCLMYMVARISAFRCILKENVTLLTIACAVYSGFFTSIVIKGGNLCIIRIICLYKMTFLDETIGETKVRIISSVLTFASGLAAASLLVFYDETNAGTFKNLLIDQPTPSGKE